MVRIFRCLDRHRPFDSVITHVEVDGYPYMTMLANDTTLMVKAFITDVPGYSDKLEEIIRGIEIPEGEEKSFTLQKAIFFEALEIFGFKLTPGLGGIVDTHSDSSDRFLSNSKVISLVKDLKIGVIDINQWAWLRFLVSSAPVIDSSPNTFYTLFDLYDPFSQKLLIQGVLDDDKFYPQSSKKSFFSKQICVPMSNIKLSLEQQEAQEVTCLSFWDYEMVGETSGPQSLIASNEIIKERLRAFYANSAPAEETAPVETV